MSRLDSFVARFTSRQIAIAGGIVVSFLLLMSFVTFAFVGWSYSVDLAAKREQERVAKEKEKAVADIQKAFSNIFKPPVEPKQAEFKSPNEPHQIGDAKIEFLGGEFGVFKYKYRGMFNGKIDDGFTQKKTFNVRFRLTNTSEVKIIEYLSWHGGSYDQSVKDEHGNRATTWRSVSSIVSGYGVSGPLVKIKPGESIEDVFGFEETLPIAKTFFAELQGGNVGHLDGQVRVAFPREYFKSK